MTRTTILFDEFDPILRRRGDGDERAPSVFSFLTPGMLPKLKTLNSRAKEHRSVFFLMTNRIGTLDEAAIRSGRFDFKIGVFPPDAMARAGHMAKALRKTSKNGMHPADGYNRRLAEVVIKLAGGAMTPLARKGNFRPCSSQSDMEGDSALAYVFENKGKYHPPPLDAKPGPDAVEGGTPVDFEDLKDLERSQWAYIMRIDLELIDRFTFNDRFEWNDLLRHLASALTMPPKAQFVAARS